MAKRGAEDKKQLNPESHIDFPGHALSLKIGAWKTLFSSERTKIMIARALNHCTCEGHFNIKGYLITDRRLYLVIKMELDRIDHVLSLFYDALKKEIEQYLYWLEKIEKPGHAKRNFDFNELWKHPFTRYLLLDFDFIDAITHKTHALNYYYSRPHYNPRLARLVNKMQKYSFCSSIDYSGASGPVLLHGICPDKYAEKDYKNEDDKALDI